MAIKDTFALQLRRDACTQCGICADSCPFGAIQFNEYPEVDPYTCRLCGTCVQACPAEAWDMQEAAGPVAQPAVSAKGIWVLAVKSCELKVWMEMNRWSMLSAL